MFLDMMSPINPPTRAYDAAGRVVQLNGSASVAQRAAGIVGALARFNPIAPASILKPAAEGAKSAGAAAENIGAGAKSLAESAGRGLSRGVTVVVVIVALLALAQFAPLLVALRRS